MYHMLFIRSLLILNKLYKKIKFYKLYYFNFLDTNLRMSRIFGEIFWNIFLDIESSRPIKDGKRSRCGVERRRKNKKFNILQLFDKTI